MNEEKLPQYTFGWKGVAVLIIGATVMSGIFMVPEIISIIIGKGSLMTTNLGYSVFANFAVMLGVVIAFDIFCCRRETGNKLKFNLLIDRPITWSLIFPMMFGMSLIAEFFASLIPVTGYFEILYEQYMGVFMKMSKNIPLFVISTVVLAPILEEIIFRGIIQKGLINKGWKPMTAIWISAVVFGIVHANPWQFVGAVLLGFVLGDVYHRTKSLLLPILLHAFNNLISCLMMIFVQEESFADLLNIGETMILFIGMVIFGVFYILYRKKYSIL